MATQTFEATTPINLSGLHPSSLVVRDFNGDGRADFCRTRTRYHGYRFDARGGGAAEHAGDRTFQTAPLLPGTFQAVSLAAGSFIGDDVADIAVGLYKSSPGPGVAAQGEVECCRTAGDGTFQATACRSTWATSTRRISRRGDFNGDGRADIAVVSQDLDGNSELELLLGNGDGTFRPTTPVPTSPEVPLSAGDCHWSWSDRPRRGQLPWTLPGRANSRCWCVSQGDGTFRATTPINLNILNPSFLLTGDFNGGGHADLAVFGSGRANARWPAEIEESF